MRAVRLILALFIVVLAGAAAIVVTHRHEASIEEARASLPVRLDAKDLKMGEQVFIRVFKQESELELWMRSDRGWKLFHSYAICRWSGELGPKLKTGDRQAPEGFYRVGLAQLNPSSRWHKSFNIGFPNEYDRTHGRTGSYLMVHGGCSSAGCYAMTNGGVDDIYRLVDAALTGGQPAVDIHAFPFRMTEANMKLYSGSRWMGFWRDLKRGYDMFERVREIPVAGVRNGRYVVFAANDTADLREARLISAWQ